jgi:hypothetical protein
MRLSKVFTLFASFITAQLNSISTWQGSSFIRA